MVDILPNIAGKKVYKMIGKRSGETHFDAIVIGSGMGGMCCATALAKYGKKVLVLEQHYLPGGYTHMFTRKGYSWDVGVHAIGEMGGNTQTARMFNWLSDKGVNWISLGEDYDSFIYPDGYKIAFPNDKNEYIRRLKEDFPDETEKLDEYFKLVKKAAHEAKSYFAFKLLPEKIDSAFSRINHKFQKDWWEATAEDVLQEMGLSEKLITVLTAQWGYHGNIPNEASFAIHALIVNHFAWGAYYPQGGSKSIASALLSQVENAGGETLCRAFVEEVLVEGNKAVGVRLKTGEKFYAPKIISAIPAKKTVENLIPSSFKNTPWAKEISKIPDSPPYLCLHMGFKGDIKKAGAKSTNMWFMNTYSREKKLWDISDPNSIIDILYVSFPSLKDPEHNPGEEMIHTGEAVTFVPYDIFEKWKNSDYGKRDQSYKDFKNQIEKRIIDHLKERIPDIMQYLDFVELSTPLTSEHFVEVVKGAIYGLDSSPARFACKKLRPRTPIKGFYLSGVDITTTGVMGGMTAGLITAATIEPKVIRHLL